MPTTTVLLILLALLTALALAAFQYLYRTKGSRMQNGLLVILRFITLFSVFLLLINPTIRTTEYFIEKPKLILAVDNSASISHFQRSDEVRRYVNSLAEDPEIQDRFDVDLYSFGSEVSQTSQFDFNERQTDLSKVLKELEPVTEGYKAPTILITDGNQTLGEDLLYASGRYGQPLYPVIIGDTTSYRDLEITRLNANRYAFLNNRFPIEIMVQYSGEVAQRSQVEIRSGDQRLFSENVVFGKNSNSAVITTHLPATSVGVHTYTAVIAPFPGEKNTRNNNKEFAVEVIDERSSVLVLFETLHPDLGTLKKAIESNEQREVILQHISEETVNPEDFQLVILYQPTSQFMPVLDQLQEKKRNYWIITGSETDWQLLNQKQGLFRQEVTGQTEEFVPVFNPNFNLFQADDIGFSKMPPLKGNFGNLMSEENIDILLFKEIQGVETDEPLLVMTEENGTRNAFLFGTDMWRWRSHVYRETGSFENFDDFIGKIIQFLSSDTRKDRLTVSYEPLYRGSDHLVITAKYFDRTYVFNNEGKLNLRIKNVDSNEVRQVPFLLRKDQYEVDLSSLPFGEYDFTVNVADEGLSRSGRFKLLSFDIEKQFTGANMAMLEAMAERKGEELYFPDKPEALKKELLTSNSYLPVQKSRENNVPLIDWYYLLGILILSLSVEWFFRKYYGLI